MIESPVRDEEDASRETVRPRSATFAAMSIELYPRLWTIGFLWNLTRWMSLFLCSYLVNQLTHSPFLVQGVGVAFFAPMFLGGAVGGVISDRLDRRRTMLGVLLLIIPAAVVMAVVNIGGVMQAWMAYPYMLAVGVSMVVEMTSRRSLVYDLVGPEQITNALALESLAMTGGTLLGTIGAGSVISVVGSGQAFLVVAVAYAVSFALLLAFPTARIRVRPAPAIKPDVVKDLRAAFAYVRRHHTLISVLGVTILMNSFYFPFTPLVPVFADRLGVNAFLAGVLASATACGSLLGTFLIARGLPFGRGRIYFGGSLFALVLLGVFAAATWYPLALLALVLAGVGISGFGTMQSVLVMVTAEDEMRGRAMGLLSMSIGALPFAMLSLGGLAQLVGASTALVASTVVGFVAMCAWARFRPESQNIA